MEVFTNLITPFDSSDLIDYEGVSTHLNNLVEQGCQNIIIGSTTGETDSLTFLELKHLIRYICYHYSKLSVYVTIDEINTKKAIQRIANLKDIELLSGFIIELPNLRGLNQTGLIKHLDLIATATKQQLIIKQDKDNQITLNNLFALKEKHDQLIGLIVNKNNYNQTIMQQHHLDLYLIESILDLQSLKNYDGIISDLANLNYQQYINLINQDDELSNDYLKMLLKYFHQENIASTLKYVLAKNGDIDYRLRLPLTKINVELKKLLDKLLYQR